MACRSLVINLLTDGNIAVLFGVKIGTLVTTLGDYALLRAGDDAERSDERSGADGWRRRRANAAMRRSGTEMVGAGDDTGSAAMNGANEALFDAEEKMEERLWRWHVTRPSTIPYRPRQPWRSLGSASTYGATTDPQLAQHQYGRVS